MPAGGVQMREEMKKLTQLKPAVAAFGQEQETLKASDGVREKLLAALKTCDEQVSAIKGEEEKQRAHVNELRSKEASKSVDISALYKEREECWCGLPAIAVQAGSHFPTALC